MEKGLLIALVETAEAGRSAEVDRLIEAIEALGFAVLHTEDTAVLTSSADELGAILVKEGVRSAWLAEKLGTIPSLAEVPLIALWVGSGGDPSFLSEGEIHWPCDPTVLRLTLERHVVERQARAQLARADTLLVGVASAADNLANTAELERNLDGFVQSVCQHLGASEGALIVLGKSDREAWMVASHEGSGGPPIPLDEPAAFSLVERIAHGQSSLLEDPDGDGLLARVLGREDPRAFGRTLTFSVPVLGRPAGGLVIALSAKEEVTLERVRMAGILLSTLLGGALGGSNLWKRLREQTKPVNLDRMDSELRNRALRRYREFFESVSDGVIVLDGQGRVMHINRSGAMMTGYAEGWLHGRALAEIVVAYHREGLAEILRQGAAGQPLGNFDLQLQTTSGDVIIVDVSASRFTLEERLYVLTFRDVTEARAIEDELTKTKEFLERLIASAVDAIVAADVGTGNIILFNEGASRLFDRPTEHVVGHLTLADLFPEEEYENFLRQLHGPQLGGVGRLLQSHFHARDSLGQHLPVSLTAATIYEADREVALVAILTDQREQLQIQERLAMAQEKLELTEKQALIAELAGTTAHELNQPLTSVMGYAELVVRKAGEDSPLAHPLKVILQEAGRMAEIVRKIGKITRYETKSYVGGTQILDLDRATEE